jgi:aspartate/methionine/tyrosine aminotransferase
MLLEEWFDKYQFEVDYDIGESGVKYFKLKELNLDLNDVELRYIHHLGNPELRQAVAKEYNGLYEENIAITTGAAESIFAINASITTRTDRILVECPNYPSFWYIPQSLERKMDLYFLKFEEDFKLNFERLESMIQPDTKLICLTHPNNPTGSVLTESDLAKLVALIEEHNIFLLLDETYRNLSFKRPPPPGATLSPNIISVSTMSKVYGVPGIRIGWSACLDNSVIDGILRVREQKTICNSALNETIALQLLKQKESHLRPIKKKIKLNFDILEKWMTDQEWLDWVVPEGSVTCFPRFFQPTTDLCKLLIEKYRTFTVPGYCFQMDTFFRLGFGGDTEELASGLEKLELATNEIVSKRK